MILYPDTLLDQFKSKPRYKGILDAYFVECEELREVFADLTTLKSIADSEGAQLDLIGARIGQIRKGWDDATYRTMLNLRVFLNNQTSTIPDLSEIFIDHQIIDRHNAITVRSEEGFRTDSSIKYYWDLLQKTKPAGVRGDYMHGVDNTDQFRFDLAKMPPLVREFVQEDQTGALRYGAQTSADTAWFINNSHYCELNFVTGDQTWYARTYTSDTPSAVFFDALTGRLWSIPYDGYNLIYWDIVEHTETAQAHGLATATELYKDFIYDAELSKLICVPYHTNKILTIDLPTATFTTYQFDSAINYYYFFAGIKASTGDYWFTSYKSPNIMRFTGSAHTNYAHGRVTTNGVFRSVVEYKQKLYFAGYFFTSVNLTSNALTNLTFPTGVAYVRQAFVRGREIVLAGSIQLGLLLYDTAANSWRSIKVSDLTSTFVVYPLSDDLYFYHNFNTHFGNFDLLNAALKQWPYAFSAEPPYQFEVREGLVLDNKTGCLLVALNGSINYTIYLACPRGAQFEFEQLNDLYVPTKNLIEDGDCEDTNTDNWSGASYKTIGGKDGLLCIDTGAQLTKAEIWNSSYRLEAWTLYKIDFYIKCLYGELLTLEGSDGSIYHTQTLIPDVWMRISKSIKTSLSTYLHLCVAAEVAADPVTRIMFFTDCDLELSGVTNWTKTNADSVLAKESIVKMQGTQSIRLDWAGASTPEDRFFYFNGTLPLIENIVYTLHGYAQARGPVVEGVNDYACLIALRNGVEIYNECWPRNTWTPFEIPFIAQATNEIRLGTYGFEERIGSNQGTSFYFDNLYFTYVDTGETPDTRARFQLDKLAIYKE